MGRNSCWTAGQRPADRREDFGGIGDVGSPESVSIATLNSRISDCASDCHSAITDS